MAVELLRAEPLLAVASEDRLYRGISAFHGLKRCQRSVYPILGQMVQDGVGLLAGRHGPQMVAGRPAATLLA